VLHMPVAVGNLFGTTSDWHGEPSLAHSALPALFGTTSDWHGKPLLAWCALACPWAQLLSKD